MTQPSTPAKTRRHRFTLPPHQAWPASDTDLDIMARTLWGEARGESRAGKIAVAWVIRNRAALDLNADNKPDWWGEGISGVCQARAQFSCWNHDDPNRAKLLSIGPSDRSFAECLHIASGVLLATLADPTAGSTHYHTVQAPVWANAWPPGWAAGHTSVATIGQHVFYNDID